MLVGKSGSLYYSEQNIVFSLWCMIQFWAVKTVLNRSYLCGGNLICRLFVQCHWAVEGTIEGGGSSNFRGNWGRIQMRLQHLWNSDVFFKKKSHWFADVICMPCGWILNQLLFFCPLSLLGTESNTYCNHYSVLLDSDGHWQLPDITVEKTWFFLGVVI